MSFAATTPRSSLPSRPRNHSRSGVAYFLEERQIERERERETYIYIYIYTYLHLIEALGEVVIMGSD